MESRPGNLTPRQREVVRLYSLGCTRKEAAAIMGLSPNTVYNHKFAAMNLLGISRQTLLVRLSIKYKLRL